MKIFCIITSIKYGEKHSETCITGFRLVGDSCLEVIFAALTKTTADLVDVHLYSISVLPQVESPDIIFRRVALEVAKTLTAEDSVYMEFTNFIKEVEDAIWQPVYPPIEV